MRGRRSPRRLLRQRPDTTETISDSTKPAFGRPRAWWSNRPAEWDLLREPEPVEFDVYDLEENQKRAMTISFHEALFVFDHPPEVERVVVDALVFGDPTRQARTAVGEWLRSLTAEALEAFRARQRERVELVADAAEAGLAGG